MNKKFEVRLSDEHRKKIQKILEHPKTCAGLRKRCLILIQADETQGVPATQAEIAKRCQTTETTVGNVVRQFAQDGLAATLRYNYPQTPGRKPKVTGEIEARIVALACDTPPEGFARWTLRLLSQRIVELEILPMASKDLVRRVLKKRNFNLI
ncbi:helix-turn-helix domain-containing protein [Paenibacillus campi]|uniref:helix-turn-helix domain-containing protein n=1 Tax=Paenibacillus campi TaxID=3106031 RepID=UPI002AFE61A1|nr:helix-turn-helix domain-containing protein [Paenibacillus sp. SGZ-1009]